MKRKCSLEDIQFIKYCETTGNPFMKYHYKEVEYYKSGLVKTYKWEKGGPKEIAEVNKPSTWMNQKIRRLIKMLNRDDLTPITTCDDTLRTIKVFMSDGDILEYPATCNTKDGRDFFFNYESFKFVKF